MRALLIPALILIWQSSPAQNPFITHMYTADPSARVFNDTLFVYPSHDEDMISYDGKVYLLEGTDDFFEAVWMHKHRGSYYLSYVGKSGEIKYGMSDHPPGPFEYKGVILPKMNSGTNHHSIARYKGPMVHVLS